MAERELVHKLSKMGFMVIRAPHSGSMSIASPDVIATKSISGKTIAVAIECKAHVSAFSIRPEQMEELKQWEDKGGAHPFVAWKVPYKGWHFFHLSKVMENKGNIGKKFAEQHAFLLDDLEKNI